MPNRNPFVLLLLLILPAPLAAAEHSIQRTISVSGRGRAAAPPDMANIRTGVATAATTAKEALEANNRAMENVMQVLTGKNIEEKDIQTSGFHVQPEFKRGPRGSGNNQITGYRVTNQVRVRVRNLPRLGEILDALVQAGSNQISGVNFDIAEPRAITNEARKRAIDDARGRAELYARATGVSVGQIISISEQAVQMPLPRFQARTMMAESSSVPVATGEQEVSATIHVVYAIAD